MLQLFCCFFLFLDESGKMVRTSSSALLNRTFHLPTHEHIRTFALTNIHYLYNILLLKHLSSYMHLVKKIQILFIDQLARSKAACPFNFCPNKLRVSSQYIFVNHWSVDNTHWETMQWIQRLCVLHLQACCTICGKPFHAIHERQLHWITYGNYQQPPMTNHSVWNIGELGLWTVHCVLSLRPSARMVDT